MKDYNQIWPHSALLYRLLAPEVIMSVIMTGTNLESGRVYRVNQHRPVVSERKVKYTGGTAMEIVVITGSTKGIGYGLADSCRGSYTLAGEASAGQSKEWRSHFLADQTQGTNPFSFGTFPATGAI